MFDELEFYKQTEDYAAAYGAMYNRLKRREDIDAEMREFLEITQLYINKLRKRLDNKTEYVSCENPSSKTSVSPLSSWDLIPTRQYSDAELRGLWGVYG